MKSSFFRSTGVSLFLVLTLISCKDGTSPPVAPGVPLQLQAEALTQTSVEISWEAGEGTTTRFQLQRAAEGGTFSTIQELSANSRSYVDSGLAPSTEYQYRIQGCNEESCSDFTGEAFVQTLGPLVITTTSLPGGILGEPYSSGVDAEGGNGVYEWEVTAGALPPGLSTGIDDLTDPDLSITGVPEETGTYTFTLQVRSEDGQSESQQFTIEVAPEPTAVEIETSIVPPATISGPYDVLLEATGGSGSNYSWNVVSGSLPPGISLTSTGVLEGAPSATGTFNFTVQAESQGQTDQESFSIPVVPYDTTRFNITPFNVVDVPSNIQSHVNTAIEQWEEIIRGNLGGIVIPRDQFPSESTACGGFGDEASGTSVDDIMMIINIAPIDGEGKVLGQAGPCLIRNSNLLPPLGVLTLDSDDLEPLVGTNTLTYILFHEMGHILGFGTLWDENLLDLVAGSGTSDPRFTGTNAVREYQNLGGEGEVPLETQGGEGTAESHWSETRFDEEIMTGFSEAIGVTQPLSRMTIGSMEDMGYTVDYSAADSYSLMIASLMESEAMKKNLGHDHIYTGPIIVVDDRRNGFR